MPNSWSPSSWLNSLTRTGASIPQVYLKKKSPTLSKLATLSPTTTRSTPCTSTQLTFTQTCGCSRFAFLPITPQCPLTSTVPRILLKRRQFGPKYCSASRPTTILSTTAQTSPTGKPKWGVTLAAPCRTWRWQWKNHAVTRLWSHPFTPDSTWRSRSTLSEKKDVDKVF